MPIKISDVNKRSSINSISPKDNNQSAKTLQTDFSTKLQKLSEDQLENKLQLLLEEINNQSRVVENKFHLSEVMKYKKLVKEFLNLTVNNSHKFSKESFLDRRGRHRVMSIVRKVNDELEGLTKDFLSKEQANLKVLKRLDDIRGLLIDIFM